MTAVCMELRSIIRLCYHSICKVLKSILTQLTLTARLHGSYTLAAWVKAAPSLTAVNTHWQFMDRIVTARPLGRRSVYFNLSQFLPYRENIPRLGRCFLWYFLSIHLENIMSESNNSETKYFDLHTTGIGYLNRVREVLVRKGEPFLAVDIAAIHGSSDDIQTVRFDCRVSGAEAKEVIAQLKEAIENKRKVLVGFKLGDLYVDTFVYERGEKTGQTGVSLKARLLKITWAKVDGQQFALPSAQNDEQEPLPQAANT